MKPDIVGRASLATRISAAFAQKQKTRRVAGLFAAFCTLNPNQVGD